MSQRVLFLGEYGWRNGGENSFLAIAPLLMQQGCEFIAAVPASSEFSTALETLGCEVIDLRLLHQGHRKSQSLIREELERLVRHIRPGLVHCNSLSTSRLTGPVTRSCMVPSVGYLRDILRLSAQAIGDISQIDQLVAVSQATRDYHIAAGLPAQKVQLIYNGVDLDRFNIRPRTGELHSRLDIPDSGRIIICVGQIGIRKGVDTVLQSFLGLAGADPSLQLVLAGARHSQKQEAIEYERKLKTDSEASSFSDRIHWLGRMDDIPRLMNEAILLLHGARQEPLGRVLLESASSGLPLVATRVGGTPEIVADTEIDLVPMDDATEMSRVAHRLLESSARRGKLSRELRDRAVHSFSIQQCADKLGNLYRQLLSG